MSTDSAGFTREDVSALEWVYRRVIEDLRPLGPDGSLAVERLHGLAARITALLPPPEDAR